MRIICKQQQSAKYDFRHGKTRPIPSFICLLARLALLCVVNRISELRATNKIPTIKSFPCFFSATTTIPSKEKRKKNSFIIPEHKSLRQSMKETQVAQKGLPVAYRVDSKDRTRGCEAVGH